MHLPSQRRSGRRRTVALAAVGVLVAVGIVLAIELPSSNSGSSRAATSPQASKSTATRSTAATTTNPKAVATTGSTAVPGSTVKVVEPPVTAPPTTVPAATLSSCRSVVHIGDSTSETLISPDYLPNPLQRLSTTYAQVGAIHQNFQISGARSIVETYEGQPNAYTVAQEIVASGYQGCWVVDMGVNDAADIAVGSHVGAAQRIQSMMSVIGRQPVMWVAVRTLVPSGPYAETNMQAWNAALLQACATYRNMRVFNWSALAQPGYYIADGIHYNTPGSAVLAAAFATALVRAFPATGPAPSQCLVP
jgi:hypothetical protein